MDEFDLNEFHRQLERMKNMGSMRALISKIPGMGVSGIGGLAGIDVDREVKRIQGVIDSMTPAERKDPGLIELSRRRRIASGSGADPADVSGLVRQFDAMAAVLRRMGR